MSPHSKAQVTLTEEQQLRIAANLQAAKDRLATKRAAAPDLASGQVSGQASGPSGTSTQTTPRRKKPKYVEYDLSTLQDSRGGFLLPEEAEQAGGEGDRRDRPTRDLPRPLPTLALSLNPEENPKCRECESTDLDVQYYTTFAVSVCHRCRKEVADKYSLLTKTECKEDYLLTDEELRDEAVMPHLSRPNPHKAHWSDMHLFLREQVEDFAFAKWGSPEALDAEYARREEGKKVRAERKFRQKVHELRRRTRTSTWNKKRLHSGEEDGRPHRHKFTKEEGKEGKEVCSGCGLTVDVDEF
ncbi:XPA protein C-terminus-domain-containing protein [Piptocephalis cylindrospora]|uniref:XPA protein C-terminus-domain-containing protein n=1 Tax=Piptocephalis cylindrospora TaxID=1907219 RepID=A0A4P9XYP1_9FUNG|nr:XPA protein C-terminus-domain-containing protein [Piptocephalis cylindrospora]|eukprot:RKP11232.1 XPA protein C-terminus-domain-containing protein [Piptocephalis cylindrospora]